ncbi:hypothetical protein KD923_20140, partial [Escherichia fergusonii]
HRALSEHKTLSVSWSHTTEYPISSIGSSVGDSYWYGFWSDTPDMEVKTFDAYVDGKKSQHLRYVRPQSFSTRHLKMAA